MPSVTMPGPVQLFGEGSAGVQCGGVGARGVVREGVCAVAVEHDRFDGGDTAAGDVGGVPSGGDCRARKYCVVHHEAADVYTGTVDLADQVVEMRCVGVIALRAGRFRGQCRVAAADEHQLAGGGALDDRRCGSVIGRQVSSAAAVVRTLTMEPGTCGVSVCCCHSVAPVWASVT